MGGILSDIVLGKTQKRKLRLHQVRRLNRRENNK
jgi:hypothetical protein